MTPRSKLPALEVGNVIKTHPKDGFWGCAVVLNTRKKCSQFNPFCLIGIAPIVLRHDFAWSEVANLEFSILEFVRGIRLFPGDTRSRRETCIGWYDARPNADLPTIGSVDASQVFQGPVVFEIGDATNGKWPLCGRIPAHLGIEAVIAWRRIHDAAQLAIDEEASAKAHDELIARLKPEAKKKRDARKLKKA